MAHVYVDSNAAGGGTGADWANAYTTLTAAFAAKAAGDNFWVAHNHAESTAGAVTLTSKGTGANPSTVMCVTSAGTVPPVSADLRTTATVTTTGANALTFDSCTFYYGITFQCGSGAVNTAILWSANDSWHKFKSCQLAKLGTTANAAAIVFGAGGGVRSTVILDNTTVRFGATGDAICVRHTSFNWMNTPSAISASGSTPTTLFSSSTAWIASKFYCSAVDLSLVTGQLFGNSLVTAADIVLDRCKLGAGVTIGGLAATSAPQQTMYLTNCDSGATNYTHTKINYCGTQSVETTVVRTHGATNETTPISWKIVTTANSKWILPFESLPMSVWNDATGADVTVSVYGYVDAAAVPKNDDIWIELSYMGSSATPVATINTANTKADYLATNADQGSDSSTWGGGDTTTRFVMSVTLSSPQPAMKGPIYVTVKAAKASTTYYIDPKPVITGVVAGKSYIVAPGVFTTVSGVAANPRLGYVL